MSENKSCTRCEGTGKAHYGACPFCHGQGNFPPVNITEIVVRIYNHGGRRAHGKFRAVFPTALRRGSLLGIRAYYVWRMARFHGGADVRMPVVAGLLSDGDPFRTELDELADKVAKFEFGTDMAAAKAWKGLLY